MNLTELIAAIEDSIGTVTHDPSVREMPVEIDDTNSDLTLTIFEVKVDRGRLVFRCG